MIPIGSFDHDRVAHAAASAHRDARMSDVEASRREAEVVLERLLARWQREQRTAAASAYLWDEGVRDAIDALSEVGAAIGRLHHGPRLVRPRTPA
ncbi:hypothetical protein ASG76_01550 [Nocardioides sp. Soil774]|uniref:hypothetical protein n=1 Tax=Nocardioides sp. Soil774 TaxID=1736408 RepID=UPI0006FEC681|nr:hypothetical protein [Nocardioides sp. Soil774]KRE97435.1 hypothetical protein ASG76_01550 [Nocardioides sp. Soil774]